METNRTGKCIKPFLHSAVWYCGVLLWGFFKDNCEKCLLNFKYQVTESLQ